LKLLISSCPMIRLNSAFSGVMPEPH